MFAPFNGDTDNSFAMRVPFTVTLVTSVAQKWTGHRNSDDVKPTTIGKFLGV